ncbi:MAG TPA: MFS transporter [Planctomycetota bacterium]|nr:MFS transporter [Planctomycetota bacterium]
MNASPDVRTADAALAPRATRARYGVIAFAASVAALTYIDRVCMSKAESFITEEFGLTFKQMGYVMAAFSWGYALFEVPGGWLGDRIGPRKVLTRIVLWWSFFTAATCWAWNLISLITIRFLFGTGEAGCFPNVAKSVRTWMPESERVRAQSIIWLSARWGGAFTPFLIVVMLDVMPWRATFYVFGALGLLWSFFFYRWYRDNPRDLKSANQAELALIEGAAGAPAAEAGPTPWKAMLASRTVWLLCLQYMFLAYAWFFYVSWLPRYLKEELHVEGKYGAFLNTFPLFLGGVGCLVSPAILNAVIRWTGSVRTGRRIVACVGFGVASLFLLLSLFLKNPLWAMIAMGIASFANDFVMPVSWAAAMDVGGRHTGTLSGVMNMASAVGGSCASIFAGAIRDATGRWDMTFYVSSVVYLLGIVCWLAIDPVTPLVRSEESKPVGDPA